MQEVKFEDNYELSVTWIYVLIASFLIEVAFERLYL